MCKHEQGLQKYGLQKGHIVDMDLQLPWLALNIGSINKPSYINTRICWIMFLFGEMVIGFKFVDLN